MSSFDFTLPTVPSAVKAADKNLVGVVTRGTQGKLMTQQVAASVVAAYLDYLASVLPVMASQPGVSEADQKAMTVLPHELPGLYRAVADQVQGFAPT